MTGKILTPELREVLAQASIYHRRRIGLTDDGNRGAEPVVITGIATAKPTAEKISKKWVVLAAPVVSLPSPASQQATTTSLLTFGCD